MRSLLLIALTTAAACSGANPSSSGARIIEAPANSPHPFPTIEGSTLAELRDAACDWAIRHYEAPSKPSAETPVIYREMVGDPEYVLNNAPPGLGFTNVFVSERARETPNASAPQTYEDFFTTDGSYRLHLIDRRDANSVDPEYCQTNRDQTIYLDTALLSFEGGAQNVCVNVSREEPPQHAAVLERYERVPTVSGRYTVNWGGYRWSEGGFVAFPSFAGMTDEEFVDTGSFVCPDSFVEGYSHRTELDRRNWLVALAPLPSPIGAQP